MDTIDEFRKYAKEHELELIEVPGGLGIRFRDGFDFFWVLPEEGWHFLNRGPAKLTIARFEELNRKRKLVVEAIRRYLGEQKVALGLAGNGRWSTNKDGCISELSVGPSLTRKLMEQEDLAAAVREVFEYGYLKKPSVHRAERLLQEFGQPVHKEPWSDEEITLIPQTPLAALGLMGFCKALHKEKSFASPEAFVAAAQPKGRIGRALLQVAQRLPNVKTSVEILSGGMELEYEDDYDTYSIVPKSRELHELLRKVEPEVAGNHLADEYLRLNESRRRVINAVLFVLHRHDYFLDTYMGQHVGREIREFPLLLGKNLTAVLKQCGEEHAIRQVLGANPALADEAVAHLDEIAETVTLIEKSLPPKRPEPFVLPELKAEQMAVLDECSTNILREFLTSSDEALWAFSNPLMWDGNIDSWASDAERRQAAEKHMQKYQHVDAQLLLADMGDMAAKQQLMDRLQSMEPHYETADQDVEMVWRMRREMPELATRWFAPADGEEVPFDEVRCRLGDPVAIADGLFGTVPDEDDEIIPSELAQIPRELVPGFVGAAQVEKWHQAACRWAEEAWLWSYGGEDSVIKAAANMGWRDVFERIERNPFVLPGLLRPGDGDLGILFANELLLAWSKTSPSEYLLRLAGYVLSLDLGNISDAHTLRMIGSAEFAKKNAEMVKNVSGSCQERISVALAICWDRCRKSLG